MKLSRFNVFKSATIVSVVLAGFLLLSSPASANAQVSPEDTLTAFYKWYLHELSSERYPRPTTPKVNSAISSRLKRWFKTKEGREWDADYFIDAQDWDPKWETNIATSKAVIKGNNAEVRVSLGPRVKAAKSMSPHTLRIKMVRESGAWKIDRINGY